MAKLIRAVHVRDPERHRTVVLRPGEEPAPHLAALITNPDAWEDGKLPDAQNTGDGKDDTGDGDDQQPTKQAAPAAKKTAARKTAATKPARGRDAADEGSSGE
jgi:hypothetical protein